MAINIENEPTEMDNILSELFDSAVVDKFRREKVFVSTVPLLTDRDLEELGIKTVGDRAVLRKRCRDSERSNKISDEVQRIMGPSTPNIRYSSNSSSLSNVQQRYSNSASIPRRPGRKGKYQIALEKSGSAKRGRACNVTFQKKVVIFRDMGEHPPTSFTRSDKDILTSGLLPVLSVDATEEEIRNEICAIVNSCKTKDKLNLSVIAVNDFHFINMSGKHATVPHCKEGFEWNGRAVKELAGSGSVYVRLTKTSRPTNDTDDDDDLDLPQCSVTTPLSNRDAIASTSQSYDGNDDDYSISTPMLIPNAPSTSYASPILIDDDQMNDEQTEEATISVDSTLAESVENGSEATCSNSDISKLAEMFPCKTIKQLTCIYNLSGLSLCKSFDCLIEGPSFDSIRSVAICQITVPSEESPRIRVDVDDDADDWTEAAVAFYKNSKFDRSAGVRISIRGQPAVDVGGVRRQFFFTVLNNLAHPTESPSALTLFEGNQCRLRPAYKASILSSGMLTTIGTMIAHSILLDGQGFPYLSEYCYYYIADRYNQAITSVTIDDVGANVKFIVEKLQDVTNNTELKAFQYHNQLMELMDKSGCDLTLEISNKKRIVDCILLYDALHKRRIYLDAFANGLEVLGLKTVISHFPEPFKSVFVFSGIITSSDVIKMLHPKPSTADMDEGIKHVWKYLLTFLGAADERDLNAFLQFITGSPNAVGSIIVTFDTSDEGEAISANTCGKQLCLSTKICEEEVFIAAMQAIIEEVTFTMP